MILKIDNLNKSFKQNTVLKNISFQLNEGEITAVIGPSGAGKTTLLRCINGLERCDSGTIEIDGSYLCTEVNNKSTYSSEYKTREVLNKLGMVFQSFNLFPHKTALQNVIEAPVYAWGMNKTEAINQAEILLSSLGLKDRMNSYPFQLSGGERQRVAIARACALNPKIMCFDEPTSALDPELTDSISTAIKELAANNITVLIITHDMSFAKKTADRVIFMEKGKIVKDESTANLFNNTDDKRINKFINS